MQEMRVQSGQIAQPEPLMTIDELATFLNVPKSWIYGHTRMAYKTGFPVVKAGKYCRFDRQEVLTWLRNGKGQELD